MYKNMLFKRRREREQELGEQEEAYESGEYTLHRCIYWTAYLALTLVIVSATFAFAVGASGGTAHATRDWSLIEVELRDEKPRVARLESSRLT